MGYPPPSPFIRVREKENNKYLHIILIMINKQIMKNIDE